MVPKTKVFLSHSSQDKIFVDRLASDLERLNVGVWYDKWELRVGDSIIDKIEQGIESQDFLIIILSPSSVASHWVKRELNAALMRELSERKVVVLPVMLESCQLPAFLREKKWADFTTSYEDGFEELVIALFPQNREGILRSRDFRTVQYLISGLAATDKYGTNTLNAVQLASLYEFRKSLKLFLAPEEKRLIFWSITSFKRVNSGTPDVLCTTTPVWGLVDDVNDEFRSQWIIDGLGGVLFEYLIPYYEWASEILGKSPIDALMRATLTRQELNNLLFETSKLSPEADFLFLKAVAEGEPSFFREYLPEKMNEDHPSTPPTIEALAHSAIPYDDQFYFSFLNSKPEVAFSAFKGLVHLKRSAAVKFLRECLEKSGNCFSTENVDQAFCLLGESAFVSALKEWLTECSDTSNRVRILATLANAGCFEKRAIYEAIQHVKSDTTRRGELLPILIHIVGRFDEDNENILEEFLNSTHPIVCEAAIFSFARQYGINAVEVLSKKLIAQSETIVAATIEALSKIGNGAAYDEILRFSSHKSSLIRSSFFRAIRIIQPVNWRSYVESGSNDPHPLVRLVAARSLASIAQDDLLYDWIEQSDMDNLFRISADEKLFTRFPFLPSWLVTPEPFDRELARLPVRLTNLDTDTVQIDTHSNLNRSIDVFLGKMIT